MANNCYSVGTDGIHKPMTDADCSALYDQINHEFVANLIHAVPTLCLVALAIYLGFLTFTRSGRHQ